MCLKWKSERSPIQWKPEVIQGCSLYKKPLVNLKSESPRNRASSIEKVLGVKGDLKYIFENNIFSAVC